MTVNEAILQAVSPIVSACEANVYQGEETTYCTFNYTEMPEHFGDDQPEFIVYLVQLHYHCPLNTNPTATAGAVFGATVDEDDGICFNESNTAPYGGLGFYIRKMVNNVVVYQGIYYPKLKATMQGESFDTKGNSITLSGDKMVMSMQNALCKAITLGYGREIPSQGEVDLGLVELKKTKK